MSLRYFQKRRTSLLLAQIVGTLFYLTCSAVPAFTQAIESIGSPGSKTKQSGSKVVADAFWESAYETLLRTEPSVRRKVESGDVTKAEIIGWLKRLDREASSRKTSGGKATGRDSRSSVDSIRNQRQEVKSHQFPETAVEYAKLIEPDLGVPPRVDLNQAVEIPLFVDGVKTLGQLTECDNPTLLGKGVTSSGSMIQRYEGRTASGEPLEDVVWVAFARHSPGFPGLGSVQMIGYNKRTGATAFFESCDALRPWVKIDPDTTRMTGVMPWIDDQREFNAAYRVPGPVQCVQCHQSDPFITDSFINAAKIPGTDESVVPFLDRDAPYYVIGGENWDMRTIHIEGNACFDCHRVGMGTVELFMRSGWDANNHMPPHDPGSLREDLRELLEVWKRGPEKVKGAEWIIPPARGNREQIVGDDYPYQAYFNRPKSLKSK